MDSKLSELMNVQVPSSTKAVTEQQVMDAIKGVNDPNTGRDFVSARAIKNMNVVDGEVAFELDLGYPAKSHVADMR